MILPSEACRRASRLALRAALIYVAARGGLPLSMTISSLGHHECRTSPQANYRDYGRSALNTLFTSISALHAHYPSRVTILACTYHFRRMNTRARVTVTGVIEPFYL
jgi:hypothetical protein